MSGDSDESVWHMPGTDARLDVASTIRKTPKGGTILTEPPLKRVTMTEELKLGNAPYNIPAHLLPA